MKTRLSIFLILLSCSPAFPQEKASWIWYPGDFEIWLYTEVGGRRQECGQLYPPFWRVDSPYGLVQFETNYDTA